MSQTSLNWDCERDGCYCQKKLVKFPVLSEAFPGKVGLTDIDAVTEVSGNILIMEWKESTSIPQGQQRFYEVLSKVYGILVVFVYGSTEYMQVYEARIFGHKDQGAVIANNLEELKAFLSEWYTWARKHPKI